MYYLVIKNLGVQKCIDRRQADTYVSGQHYTCSNDFSFLKEKFIRRLRIRCRELPTTGIIASVYYSGKDISASDMK